MYTNADLTFVGRIIHHMVPGMPGMSTYGHDIMLTAAVLLCFRYCCYRLQMTQTWRVVKTYVQLWTEM